MRFTPLVVVCGFPLLLVISSFGDSFVIGGSKFSTTRLFMAANNQTMQKEGAVDTASRSRPCCIENFRQAPGLPRIYRCASTDPLAHVVEEDRASLHEPERILMEETGLILDLRSDSERDNREAKMWTSRAPVPFLVQDVDADNHVVSDGNGNDRRVLRIDVLSPTRFMEYASDNWFTSAQKAAANFYFLFDVDTIHEMRIDALNERGLTGLNEIILETGKRELCVALQEITLHLEQCTSSIAIHCVQGKDRTGMLVMLCQSILDLSDDDIVDDYFKSNVMKASSASDAMKPRRKGRLDRNVFAGSPREACVGALEHVRNKYGSVSGYLNAIGFDESWRSRFRMAVQEPGQLQSKL